MANLFANHRKLFSNRHDFLHPCVDKGDDYWDTVCVHHQPASQTNSKREQTKTENSSKLKIRKG